MPAIAGLTAIEQTKRNRNIVVLHVFHICVEDEQ